LARGDQFIHQRTPGCEVAAVTVQAIRLLTRRDNPEAALGVEADNQPVPRLGIETVSEPAGQDQSAALTEGE
jgi:hypothetical protein